MEMTANKLKKLGAGECFPFSGCVALIGRGSVIDVFLF